MKSRTIQGWRIKTKQAICLLAFLLYFTSTQSQTKNRVPVKGFEVFAGAGLTYFSGDLGGTDEVADFDLRTIRWALGVGVRYHFNPRWGLRANFYFGHVWGADSLSRNESRRNRNLDFKSNIFDFSLEAQYSILTWGYRNVSGLTRLSRHNVYIFSGISVFHFHPYGTYNGEWYSLPELSTAGQGLPGGPASYRLTTLSIPIGIGYKYLLNKGWSIGAEISFHKTFTDHIDDVSEPYFDNAAIRQQKGIIAASVADKNLGGTPKTMGEPRGNPNQKDNFAFLLITINKQISFGKGKGKKDIPCYKE